ncbi:hypothetical protein [Aureimonas sp. AU12]|uniref:hypothetical protein n=1 Tax=Aureimonas sp. AU12 TaxID=1638161 RepID=UPI000780D7A9|nr:hypothetical protein [Aureimonas sp. AU12]
MSSHREALRAETPANLVDVMRLAGSQRRLRRWATYQARRSDTVAVYRGDRLLSVATLFPEGPHVRELCLLFDPAARADMLGLVRTAQLMLRPIADHGVVIVARIKPSNRAGRRMARLAGFLETDAEGGRLWIWRG